MRIRKSAVERKEEIVEATLTLAHEVGPDRITTEAIASRVGLTHAAIFRHFPRKQDIWDAALGWLREAMLRRWGDSQAGCASAEERLKAVLGAQLRFIGAVPALPAILLSRELGGGSPVTRRATLGLMAEFRRTLAAIVAAGQDSGELLNAPDPEQAANLLIAVVQGTAVRWLISDQSFDLLAEGLGVIDLALSGLKPAAGVEAPGCGT